jgi:hypothetical protein
MKRRELTVAAAASAAPPMRDSRSSPKIKHAALTKFPIALRLGERDVSYGRAGHAIG